MNCMKQAILLAAWAMLSGGFLRADPIVEFTVPSGLGVTLISPSRALAR